MALQSRSWKRLPDPVAGGSVHHPNRESMQAATLEMGPLTMTQAAAEAPVPVTQPPQLTKSPEQVLRMAAPRLRLIVATPEPGLWKKTPEQVLMHTRPGPITPHLLDSG